MQQTRLHLPNSHITSAATRKCSVHQDLRAAQGGWEIRPGIWVCAQCWQSKLGAIKGRAQRKAAAPVRAPGAGQRGRALGGLLAGLVVGLLLGAAVGIPVSRLKHPMATAEYQLSGPDRDSAEAQRNAAWDPNAPLYGKTPAAAMPDLASAKARLFSGGQLARAGQRRPSEPIHGSDDEFASELARIAEIAQESLQQSLPIRPNSQRGQTYPQGLAR